MLADSVGGGGSARRLACLDFSRSSRPLGPKCERCLKELGDNYISFNGEKSDPKFHFNCLTPEQFIKNVASGEFSLVSVTRGIGTKFFVLQKPFDKVLEKAMEIYEDKKKEYGESWKQMEIWQLDERLSEELMEYDHTNDLLSHYYELLDVINVSLMLAERMRQQLSELNENELKKNV